MAKNPNRVIVDTSKLTENLRVASYSQMCSLIGCDFVRCGPARISQIDNWKRYFDFTLSGHAYIINKVYDSPLPSKKEIKQQERQSIIDEEKAKKLQWHEECRLRREEQEAARQRRKIQKAEREKQEAIKATQREKRRQQKSIEEQEKNKRKIVREERKAAEANKVDGRTHRNGKYISAIEPLLLDFLKSSGNNLQIIPKDMFLLLGMVNSNLVKEGINKKTSTAYLTQKLNEKIYKSNPVLFTSVDSVGLTPQILSNFMQQSIIKVNQTLRAGLDSMVNRNLITYKTERILVRNSGDESVASLSEADRIENAEKTVLDKMGFDSIGRIYAQNKRKDFYYNVQRYLKNNKDREEDAEFYDEWEWDRFFSRLSITLNTEEDKPHNLLPSTQNNIFSCDELREQLNSQVIEFMIAKAKRVYNDFKAKCEQITLRGERLEDSSYFNKYPENYIEIISFLADYFLNIHYKEDEEETEQDAVVCEYEIRTDHDTTPQNTTLSSEENPIHHSYMLSKHKYIVYKKGEQDKSMNNTEDKIQIIPSEMVGIGEHVLPVKEYKGQRVVTFKDIDIVHNRPTGTARKRFNDNKKHFIEGEDYYKICASEIRTHKLIKLSPKAHENMVFITESGYLMLVKSFTDDLAWTVQRELVKNYFKVNEIKNTVYSLSKDFANFKIEVLREIQQLKPQQPNYWLWKKHVVNPIVGNIASAYEVDIRTVFDLIYDTMSAEFGFDRSFAISQFCSKYGVSDVAVIDTVADSYDYQMKFIEAANLLLSRNSSK